MTNISKIADNIVKWVVNRAINCNKYNFCGYCEKRQVRNNDLPEGFNLCKVCYKWFYEMTPEERNRFALLHINKGCLEELEKVIDKI